MHVHHQKQAALQDCTHKQEQVGEGLWILKDNKKIKLKLGVIYAPQENTTPNKE